jgi:hypothetical protein
MRRGNVPSTEDEVLALRDQVRALTARAEITDLINRLARELDERVLDPQRFDEQWAGSFFTEDARTSYPVGGFTGIAAIAEGIRAGMSKFVRTQHVHSNHIIDLGDDSATVRWDLLATHVLRESGEEHLFSVGDYYDGEVVRTAAGWRFRQMTLHVTWTTGTPPGRA